MNIQELKAIFEREKIPKDMYSLKGGLPNESYCISQGNGYCEVYYSERGKKTGSKLFDTEDAACLYLYNRVVKSMQ